MTRATVQAGKASKPTALVLRLYVAGTAPHSTRALANLVALCKQHIGAAYELEVVDVLKTPQRALTDGVFVTPTLMKVAPEPTATLVGDLSERALVLNVLGLPAEQGDT